MTPLVIDRIRSHASVAASWAAVALGFTIPVSTTADGVVLVVLLLAWIIYGGVRDRLKADIQHPLALAGSAFFLLLAIGALYGDAFGGERLGILRKYDDFLVPLLLLPVLADLQVRERALWTFGLAMSLTLLLSFFLAAGFVPEGSWIRGHQNDASIFKLRITHSLFMSFAAFLWVLEAGRQPEKWKRILLWSASVLAMIDVLLLVQSQTGQVGLLALIIFWCWRRLKMKGIAVGICAVAIIAIVSLQVSTAMRDRIAMVFEQIQLSQSNMAPSSDAPVAVALRLEWYKRTLAIVAANPLMGVGTGSFARAYADSVTDPTAIKPAHPHNQYLLTAAELGIPGLVGLLALFARLWWVTYRVTETFYREMGQGALILMSTGCLFNSLFLDHAEGLFFAWIMCIALAGIRPSPRVAIC